MGILKWYRRYPDAALQGMINLTFEERGAYNSILDLIYAHDGAVPDDERELARRMGVDRRIWRRMRSRLLEIRKIYVLNGYIHNERADWDAQGALYRVQKARRASRKRWGSEKMNGGAIPLRSVGSTRTS